MLINTRGAQSQNIIGQRYEVLSPFTRPSHLESLASDTPTLKIQVSIESPLSGESSSKVNQKTILLAKCLRLLGILLASAPEGLEEASEALERMVEYYMDCASDLPQPSLPQELGTIQGSLLPSLVRPPLVIDLD